MNTTFKKDEETILENVQRLDAAFDLDHEARMVSYRFLSVVDERMEELGWNFKQLADALGTSKSHVTQLFNGSRLLNMKTIAKLQWILGIEFSVVLRKE